jgi:hypothetical protein
MGITTLMERMSGWHLWREILIMRIPSWLQVSIVASVVWLLGLGGIMTGFGTESMMESVISQDTEPWAGIQGSTSQLQAWASSW